MARSVQKDGPDPVDLHVGAAIRRRRKAIGMTQGALAQGLGLTFQQLQKYERGSNRVSASKLHAIAARLGVPVGHFFEGLPSHSPPDPADTPPGQLWLGTDAAWRLARAMADLGDDRRATAEAACLNLARALKPGAQDAA